MDDNLRDIFSNNLKHLLSENEKTQADMCKYMNISSATASDWCNSKKMPRADKLQSLCTWLHCELNDLIGERPAASAAPSDAKKVKLDKLYYSLNDEGKDRLIEQGEMLASMDKYKLSESHEEIG